MKDGQYFLINNLRMSKKWVGCEWDKIVAFPVLYLVFCKVFLFEEEKEERKGK